MASHDDTEYKLFNSDVDNNTDDSFTGVRILELPSHMNDAAVELDSDVESNQEWTDDDLKSVGEYETGDYVSCLLNIVQCDNKDDISPK